MPQMLTRIGASTPNFCSTARSVSFHCVSLRWPMAMREGETIPAR